MRAYQTLLREVAYQGEEKLGRNGKAMSVTGMMFKHDLRNGFPALTLRRMSIGMAMTELRFFLSGNTNKQWLQDRGCHFWDKWHNPTSDDDNDLGPIYGSQWRDFNGETCDQFKIALETLRTDPTSRRILISAWNPLQLKYMALPPCHDSFQFLSDGVNLDLIWRQRSCDMAIGLPYDILLYGLMLSLVAKEVKMVPRYLVGQLGDCHIYDSNKDGVIDVLTRNPRILPELWLPEYNSIWDIVASEDIAAKVMLTSYSPHPAIKFEVVA